MNHYLMEERETVYRYDPIDKCWYIYSNHLPHIRKIIERAEIKKLEKDGKDRIIYVEAEASPGQIRIYHDK